MGYSLLNLRANQSLTIRYESVGRFHHYSYRFVFTENQVVIYDLGLGKRKERPIHLGSFQLSDEDLVRLDRLFAYYAEGRTGDGTTVDSIVFTERKGRRKVRSTTYADDSCPSADRKELLLLRDLAFRLLEEQPN